jgi:hypothetical protein
MSLLSRAVSRLDLPFTSVFFLKQRYQLSCQNTLRDDVIVQERSPCILIAFSFNVGDRNIKYSELHYFPLCRMHLMKLVYSYAGRFSRNHYAVIGNAFPEFGLPLCRMHIPENVCFMWDISSLCRCVGCIFISSVCRYDGCIFISSVYR